MNDDALQSLLEAAGRSTAEPPTPPPDLATRVRRLHVRRQHRRRATAGLAAAMVLLGGTLSIVFRATPPVPQPDTSIAERPDPPPAPQRLLDTNVEQLQAEIAALDAEAGRRRRHVRQMLDRQDRHDQLIALLGETPPPDPLETAHITLEKTAFRLVYHAEHQSVFSGTDAARQQYRRVVELFPHTNAAAIAREQLGQPSIEKGDL